MDEIVELMAAAINGSQQNLPFESDGTRADNNLWINPEDSKRYAKAAYEALIASGYVVSRDA